MTSVHLAGLGRTYRTQTGFIRRRTKEITAVSDLTLEVADGELFGLIGPNGAGKTTTIKMLTTLLLPSSGRATVAGYDVATHPEKVRPLIGFAFGGERGLYARVSGRDNLLYFGRLYGLRSRQLGARTDELLDLVGLRDRGDERVEGYSRGMKQRLHLARMLLHDPRVLFLDEPTIGLDPVGARELRETIQRLHAEGRTILLTTHYMFEADMLCDRIAVIADGKLIAEGTPTELKQRGGDLSVVEVEVFGASPNVLERLRSLEVVASVASEQRELRQLLRVQTATADSAVPLILSALDGLHVGRLSVREATLEDAYVRLVGRIE